MKRVCMVTHSVYAPDPRVRREAEALVEAGYAVDVIALRKPGGEACQEINGVQIHGLPVSRHQGSGIAVYLLEYLSFCLLAFAVLTYRHLRRRYAVIQVHTPPDFLVFVTLVPRLLGSRVLLDLHEIVPELFQDRFGLAADHPIIRLLKLIERLACAYAHAVLAVHDRHKEILVARGVNPAKITPIPNCPDERIFDPTWADGRDNGCFTIMYHGAVVPRYGLDVLVRAMAHLRNQCPDLRLRILGDGDAWLAVRTLVTELEVDDIVDMPGRIPLTDIPASIAEADVGVVPNQQNVYTDEILPTKLLEYMAMKRPVVAARTRLVESLFGPGQSVLLFEPGNPLDLADRIRQLYREPQTRERLIKRAQVCYENFKWERTREEYVKVVSSQLLEGKKRCSKGS
jgi:glycosyltransferase involved in cell wall biosynthesis